MHRLRLLALVALIFLAFARSSSAAPKVPPPMNDPLFMRVIARPWPPHAAILDGAGRRHSAYELYVTNFGRTPFKVTRFDVQGKSGDKIIVSQSVSGDDPIGAMFMPAQSPDPNRAKDPNLMPGQTGVFFIFADWLGDQGDPDVFDTAFTIEEHGEHAGSGTIHAPALQLSHDAPIVIHSPLQGKNWLAANAPSNTSPHRRAIIPVNGEPHIGQRYAIDWVQLGADGKTYTGDESQNSSYHAWDQEIHAAGDGKIVEVQDGIPENVPNSGKIAVPITYETLAGNHIIEDLGGGHFAAYAHLRPGTLKVKVGDNVHAGDVIAHLGNTGNSSEPHLHFQVCDAPSFVASEGLPFAIDQYTYEDYKIDKTRPAQPALILKSSHAMTRQEPMEDELDSF
jgi:hypothetical protein